MLCQFLDFFFRHTQMIKPLCCDFFTGAFLHRFFDIIAGHIREQAVNPYADLLFLLFLELSLSVDRPAQQPGGILTAYDTTGHHSAASWVTFTNICDIRQNLVIQCGHRSGFPVGLCDVGAELFRMAESLILCGYIFPQVPAAAGPHFGITVGRMVLIAVHGAFRTASVGNEYQVVFREHNALFHAFYPALNGFCHFPAALRLKNNICYFCVKAEFHACRFQIFLHGQDQRLVLVVFREFQRAEVRQPCNVVNKSLEVQLHLQRAVPVFKGEHGPPVQPEGGAEYFFIKDILDRLIIQVFVLCHKELHDLHAAFLAQIKLPVRMSVLAAVHGSAAQGIVGVFFVKPVVFVQHGHARRLQRRDAAEQIPQAFEMVLHLSAAPHDVTSCGIKDTVAGAACKVHGLQNVYVVTGHLSVSYQEACRRQRGQPAAYKISVFPVHAFRFSRSCEGFIVAVAVIDSLAVSGVLSKFRIAVLGLRIYIFSAGRFSESGSCTLSALCFFLLMIVCRICNCTCSCRYGCYA